MSSGALEPGLPQPDVWAAETCVLTPGAGLGKKLQTQPELPGLAGILCTWSESQHLSAKILFAKQPCTPVGQQEVPGGGQL